MKAKAWMIPVVLSVLQGCGDFLQETPEDFLAPENFFLTAGDAETAVAAVYEPLVTSNGFGRNLWHLLEGASDGGRNGPLATSADVQATGGLTYDPGHFHTRVIWETFYNSITRANLAADRIARIESIAADRKAALIGEVRFLRALAYFYLVRLWGDVPLVIDADRVEVETPRVPSEQVYQQIIADATEAARVLPVTWDAANRGRATRGSALALLADVHLERREWQRAADFAKQVVDLGVYRLFDDYLHAFLPAHENGVEHVFFLQAEGPTVELGSDFANMYYPRELGVNQGGGFAALQPTLWQVQSYPVGDYRRDVNYKSDWVRLDGRAFNNLYPHVFKYRPSYVVPTDNGDVNIPVYRYAEVLLIYAEALNELNRSAEAVQLVNQIRARARRGTGNENRAQPANYAGPMTQTAVRDAVYMERVWELAHESKRWFDLKRRGQDYFLSEIAAHDPQAVGLAPHRMLLPIPQTEIDLNRLLVQNPGY